VRRLTVLTATLLIGLVGGCGDDATSETKPERRVTVTHGGPTTDVPTDVRPIERCFSRLGLKPPGDLRKRARYLDFSIDLPWDLPRDQNVSRKQQDRLRSCVVAKGVEVCTSEHGGRGVGCESVLEATAVAPRR
jgi:hypothetical protein